MDGAPSATAKTTTAPSIGSDPGHALIERVTNAIDAVIEREALRRLTPKTPPPASPREAVETWLGVPAVRVANLKIKKRQALADEVVIRLLEGSSKRTPTVEIRDLGIGLSPEMLPKTILSLGESNKIDKLYLAGAYGQGGSTVLAFCPEGSIFVSRRQPDLLEGQPDRIAITFARYNELDIRKNKNGRYEYLVTGTNEIPNLPNMRLDDFAPGTAVVHLNLQIPQYSERLTQLTKSLWWLLQNAMFDPVLPIWAEEARPSKLGKKGTSAPDRRTIAGNYTRLQDDRRDRIEYADSIDVNVEFEQEESLVKVHYWVVKPREDKGSLQPIDAYVDPFKPVAYTYYGQLHGSDERRLVAERLQLSYLAKFLIIQVELDHLHPRPRRAILSTTRDRLKQVPGYIRVSQRA